MEEERGYRYFVICSIPSLRTLDFSAITKQDRDKAAAWRRINPRVGGR